jgi:hypothetical protein
MKASKAALAAALEMLASLAIRSIISALVIGLSAMFTP